MVIQGSNNPLVIQFDADVEHIPVLVVTLWYDEYGCQNDESVLLRLWNNADMEITGNTAICPITEELTQSLGEGKLIVEAKGLDENDNTIFWDQYKTDILKRRDKIITLTQSGIAEG